MDVPHQAFPSTLWNERAGWRRRASSVSRRRDVELGLDSFHVVVYFHPRLVPPGGLRVTHQESTEWCCAPCLLPHVACKMLSGCAAWPSKLALGRRSDRDESAGTLRAQVERVGNACRWSLPDAIEDGTVCGITSGLADLSIVELFTIELHHQPVTGSLQRPLESGASRL